MTETTPPEGVISAASDAEGITIVRIFDAPRDLVFKAWTEPERFATWFGEEGSSIPLETASMDVRPGGAWSVIMIYGPERMEIPFSGHYQEVVEPERLVITLADPTDENSTNVEVMTVVLEYLGDGKTQMIFTQRGGNLPPDEYSRAMRGSLVFFDRLARHLKPRHDTAS